MRSWLVAGATVGLAGAGLITATAAHAGTGCQVGYTVTNQWSGGFGANVVVTNLGDPVNGWRLAWSFGAGQAITQLWNGSYTQSGAQVTVKDAGWNGSIATGGNAAFGFNASVSGANPVPSSFALNGVTCTGAVTAPSTTSAPSPSRSTSSPTPSPSSASPSMSPSPTPTESLIFSSFDRLGTTTNGGYTLSNNVFGSGSGSQFIWAYSFHHWGTSSSFPDATSVMAYPNVAKTVNQPLSSLRSLTSSFAVLVPGTGVYNTSYDIPVDGNVDGNAAEIQLWMNQAGGPAPAGTLQATATVGGITWQVYQGSNGSTAVYSFVRTDNTTSGSVDILAVLNWLRGAGQLDDATIGDVRFGFAITSTGPGGAQNFITTGYSLSSS
jgi:hypothetical protein